METPFNSFMVHEKFAEKKNSRIRAIPNVTLTVALAEWRLVKQAAYFNAYAPAKAIAWENVNKIIF